MKNSHIQIPKTVLKEFQDEKSGFLYYYSFADDKIHRGHAKTLNTEMGYYSDTTETFLSNEIESRLGSLIKRLKQMTFEDGEEAPKDYEEIAFSYLYSLVSRSSSFFESMRKSSVFFQLFDVQAQHDLAAQNGYVIAWEMGLLNSFEVGFFLNESKESLVVPPGGVAQVGDTLYCPLTPRRGICFISNGKRGHVNTKHVPVKIIDDEMLDVFNELFYRQEWDRDKGYVISDSYYVLSGLVNNILKSH